MKASERNSYINRACRELMAAQAKVREAKAKLGIAGLLERRMVETTYDCLRAIYGQPSQMARVFGFEFTMYPPDPLITHYIPSPNL